jgi:hypothetical protein
MNAKGCPSQSCYVPKASQIGDPTDSTMCSGITQTPSQWQPQYAVDGNLSTRYTTCAAGVGTEWFQVDMCRAALVHGVTLAENSSTVNDQATAYNVQVSLDETNWTSVAMSSSVAPGTAVLAVKFAPVTARFVRFSQTGKVGTSNGDGSFVPKWWSIAEFNVTCGQ